MDYTPKEGLAFSTLCLQSDKPQVKNLDTSSIGLFVCGRTTREIFRSTYWISFISFDYRKRLFRMYWGRCEGDWLIFLRFLGLLLLQKLFPKNTFIIATEQTARKLWFESQLLSCHDASHLFLFEVSWVNIKSSFGRDIKTPSSVCIINQFSYDFAFCFGILFECALIVVPEWGEPDKRDGKKVKAKIFYSWSMKWSKIQLWSIILRDKHIFLSPKCHFRPQKSAFGSFLISWASKVSAFEMLMINSSRTLTSTIKSNVDFRH